MEKGRKKTICLWRFIAGDKLMDKNVLCPGKRKKTEENYLAKKLPVCKPITLCSRCIVMIVAICAHPITVTPLSSSKKQYKIIIRKKRCNHPERTFQKKFIVSRIYISLSVMCCMDMKSKDEYSHILVLPRKSKWHIVEAATIEPFCSHPLF